MGKTGRGSETKAREKTRLWELKANQVSEVRLGDSLGEEEKIRG